MIEVAPLEWGEWVTYLSDEYTQGGIARQCPNPKMCTRTQDYPYHLLIELGRGTNTYVYKVYASGTILLYETIRPPCCEMWKRCPIGNRRRDMEPCREYLRAQAMEGAYQLWVEFVKKLAGEG